MFELAFQVIFFTKGIFESANTGIDSGLATIIVGVMQVISVFVSSVIVDKAGRRLLLLPSALVMAITTALLGTYFFMKEKNPDSVSSLGWLPVASLCGFIILFSIGFGKDGHLVLISVFAVLRKNYVQIGLNSFPFPFLFCCTQDQFHG